MADCTLSGNAAGLGGPSNCGYGQCGGPGTPGVGGGLLESGGTAAFSYVTIASNSDGLTNLSGAVTATGSIVANSTTGPDCTGPISENQGYNLDSDTSCGFSQATDLTQTDPLLGPLADNNGATQTMALLFGSPAIDRGGTTTNGCPLTDQRGVARPQGSACDIGAYEAQAVIGTATNTPTTTPTQTLASTATATSTPAPTPTWTPTNTQTLTQTPTPPATETPTTAASLTATPPPTATASFTPSVTPTQVPTATPTATPTTTPTPPACPGDCNNDHHVTVDEILTMVNIALGNSAVTTCPAGDANHDGNITVDEILTAVNNALNGCPGG